MALGLRSGCRWLLVLAILVVVLPIAVPAADDPGAIAARLLQEAQSVRLQERSLDAQQVASRATAAAESAFGLKDPRLIPYYEAQAAVLGLYNVDLSRQAASLYDSVLSVLPRQPPQSLEVARITLLKAEALYASGQYIDAEAAAKIAAGAYGERLEAAHAYLVIYRAESARQNLPDAKAALAHALAIAQKTNGPDLPLVLRLSGTLDPDEQLARREEAAALVGSGNRADWFTRTTFFSVLDTTVTGLPADLVILRTLAQKVPAADQAALIDPAFALLNQAASLDQSVVVAETVPVLRHIIETGLSTDREHAGATFQMFYPVAGLIGSKDVAAAKAGCVVGLTLAGTVLDDLHKVALASKDSFELADAAKIASFLDQDLDRLGACREGDEAVQLAALRDRRHGLDHDLALAAVPSAQSPAGTADIAELIRLGTAYLAARNDFAARRAFLVALAARHDLDADLDALLRTYAGRPREYGVMALLGSTAVQQAQKPGPLVEAYAVKGVNALDGALPVTDPDRQQGHLQLLGLLMQPAREADARQLVASIRRGYDAAIAKGGSEQAPAISRALVDELERAARATLPWNAAIARDILSAAVDVRTTYTLGGGEADLLGMAGAEMRLGDFSAAIGLFNRLGGYLDGASPLKPADRARADLDWANAALKTGDRATAKTRAATAVSLAQAQLTGDALADALRGAGVVMETLDDQATAAQWLGRSVELRVANLRDPNAYEAPADVLTLAAHFHRINRFDQEIAEIQRILTALAALPAAQRAALGIEVYDSRLALGEAAAGQFEASAAAARASIEAARGSGADAMRRRGLFRGVADHLSESGAAAASIIFLTASNELAGGGGDWPDHVDIGADRLALNDAAGARGEYQKALDMLVGGTAEARATALLGIALAARLGGDPTAAGVSLEQAALELKGRGSSPLMATIAINRIELAKLAKRAVDVRALLMEGGIDVIPQDPVKFGVARTQMFGWARPADQGDLEFRAGTILLTNGSPPAAAMYFGDARRQFGALDREDRAAEATIGLAEALRRSGETEPAREEFAAILPAAMRLFGDDRRTGEVLFGLGACEMKLGHTNDERQLLDRADAIAAKGGASSLANDIALARAQTELDRGDADNALKAYESLAPVIARSDGPESDAAVIALVGNADALRLAHRMPEALALYDKAEEIIERRYGIWHPSRIDALAGKTIAAAALDREDTVVNLLSWLSMETGATPYRRDRRIEIEAFASAAQLLAGHGNIQAAADAAWYGADLIWKSTSEPRPDIRRTLAEIYVASKIADDPSAKMGIPPSLAEITLGTAQLTQGVTTGNAISQMAVRNSVQDPKIAAMVRDDQDSHDRIDALEDSVIASARSGASVDQATAAELAPAVRHVNEIEAQLLHDFPGYADLTTQRPATLQEIQALLQPDEAIVHYLVGERATYVWALRRDSIAMVAVDMPAADVNDAVKSLRAALDPMAQHTDDDTLPDFPIDRAYLLYRKIFFPIEPALAGVHHVLVVPDDALQTLPFAVMATEPPAAAGGAERYRTTQWLIRKYDLTTLPSLASLRALRGTVAPKPAPEPFIGFGDPGLTGAPGSLAGPNDEGNGEPTAQDILALPKLPQTAAELRRIAVALHAPPDDVVLGAAATKQAVEGIRLDRFRTLAFATHGLMAGALSVSAPALVLTPSGQDNGLLYASEIARLKLNADLIILSACNTAAPGPAETEGFSGLAKAFFFAGARALIVSHWSVASEAAAELTTATVVAMARDPTVRRAAALQTAMLAMIDHNANTQFSHPRYWAPFVVVGDGGR